MRKLIPLVPLLSVLAACGGSSSSGGGGSSGPVAGTIAGRAFTPTDVEAIVAGSGASPCTVPTSPTTSVTLGMKALAIELTSYSGACTDLLSSTCRVHQNAQTVTLLFAKLNPAPPYTEPATASLAGTYAINASLQTATPDGTGLLVTSYAQALATNAACGGTPSPSVQGGTLRIDSTAGPITGYVAVSFQDGSTLAGDFSAPICAGQTPAVCTLATAQALCTPPTACVP